MYLIVYRVPYKCKIFRTHCSAERGRMGQNPQAGRDRNGHWAGAQSVALAPRLEAATRSGELWPTLRKPDKMAAGMCHMQSGVSEWFRWLAGRPQRLVTERV